jgi:apolipoprotein N-acyltransferase
VDRQAGDTHDVRGPVAAVATAPSTSHHAPPPSDAHNPRLTGRLRRWARRAPWRAVGLAFAGGLGLDAAFAPIQWWPIAVPATAAIVLAVRGRSWRAGLLIGFAAGMGEFLPLLSWLHVVTPAAWIALALISSMYVAALGGGLAVVVGTVPGWPVWAACLWVGEELVRDRWPLGGFSWGRLAFSQPDTPFTRFAALGGAPLVTFAVALAAALLAAAVYAAIAVRPAGLHRPTIVRVVVLTMAAVGVPLLGLAVPLPTSGTAVQVAVIQGNVPHPGTHFLGEAEQVLDNHLAETAVLTAKVRSGQLPHPQLVIWPENASDVDPFETPKAYGAIQAAASAIGVPILIGAVLQDGPDNASNTGIVWDPVTGPGQQYTKRHLVPFGEYIPLRGLISHLTNLTTLVPQNFVPGHRVGALQVGPATVADVMCFEVAFDEQVRDGVNHGGQVIVVQTNNATYMHTAETRQQLAMSQLRAIEHGRSVVIAATSGISGVIGPDGRIRAQTSELTPAIIDLPVTLRSDRTLADHLGAGPEWLFGILGMVSIAAALVRVRPRRDGDRDTEAETVA